MKKKDFLQASWISMEDRLPPKSERFILVWNAGWKDGICVGMKSSTARDWGKSKDSDITHWMDMPGPKK